MLKLEFCPLLSCTLVPGLVLKAFRGLAYGFAWIADVACPRLVRRPAVLVWRCSQDLCWCNFALSKLFQNFPLGG